MELSLFDLHCDTALCMLLEKQVLTQNTLAVSLQNAVKFKRYVQVMAFWTDRRLTDENGWQQMLAMLKYLRKDPAVQNGKAEIVTGTDCKNQSAVTLLLSIEDARLLHGDLSRVDTLADIGIKILTPLWSGSTCIGGSHDTNEGLTEFGRLALARALSHHMVLDISHASEKSAEEIFSLSDDYHMPVIATHSNAYTVCSHSRNLRDGQIDRILDSGGIIGCNLYGRFLTHEPNATAKHALQHIEHFFEMGAENALCLGCDMDGCDLPPDIPNLAALPRLAEYMLQKNYPEQLVHKIFFQNAFEFAKKYFF